jgi:hypothetical protein
LGRLQMLLRYILLIHKIVITTAQEHLEL